MKRLLLLVWGVLLLWNASAQDVILLRTAEEIRATVTEITASEVKYRHFGDTEGPVRTLLRDKVFSITYSNGERDVFSSSGSVDGAYPYPAVSRSYRVGELFDEGGVRGLVVAVSDEGRHGLLLSLTEGSCMWGGAWGYEQAETFRGFECYCHSLDDGWVNMKAVSELISQTSGLTWANFPAFQWCREQGSGWYLPSIGEMTLLWNFGDANPAMSQREHSSAITVLSGLLLPAGGERMYRIGCYWTSSEDGSEERARVWTFQPEKNKYGAKSYVRLVRAFHKF